MKFPQVDLKDIFHAATLLRRARKEIQENRCAWVCDAIISTTKDNSYLWKEGRMLKAQIEKAISPYGFVTTWRTSQKDFGGTDKDYRLAWIDHMLSQCGGDSRP